MSKGYVEFFFSNAKYRRLWSASIISLLGEWFNTIALFFLILEYSGSEFLLGVLFSVRMFAFAISQPINGLLADRLNRKSLMLWSNVLQIGLALSFLLVDGKEDMWWLISISGLMMLLHGVYVTAERAALPNIVDEDDLLTANAIGSASWSSALCLGAMLGGIVVSVWGTDAAFIIDSATFLLSSLILIPLVIEQNIDESMKGPLFSGAISNIKIGWQRIYDDKRLLRIVFAKASWNIAGAGLAGVFLVLAGAEITGYGAAFGFGLFFFARGIGTGIGPILARALFKDKTKWPGLIGILVSTSGLFYLVVGLTIDIYLPLTVILIIFAHSASGGNWVLSTVLTQSWVEDEVRGRVFSMDMLILGSSAAFSTSLAGYLVEYHDLSLKTGFISFSLLMVVCGIIFTLWNPADKIHKQTV
ncbi:MAG: MFS transporter [Candidatus Poseidoniales archaeon]|nr:MFS transporter [Candidatus Poseidoniales archaeon]RJV01585.1 MAG: MFS transporter [Candidatus Poseidoniales archaeon]